MTAGPRTLGALSSIAGAYLTLAGVGRFVEESYRGEPQTAIVGGLRLYQWLSIAFVCGRGVLTALGGPAAPQPRRVEVESLAPLALAFLVTYVLFGVGLPGLNRRFSRLV